MRLKYITLFTLLITAFSCNKSKQLNDNLLSKTGSSIIALNQCKQQTTSGTIRLCFDQLVSDSRCPRNARCIWQGVAVANFTFSVNNQPATFTLATNNSKPPYTSETTVQGYKIKLLNIFPYPGDQASEVQAEVEVTQP